MWSLLNMLKELKNQENDIPLFGFSNIDRVSEFVLPRELAT